MSDEFLNGRYAQDDEEEARAEAHADSIDEAYDTQRDNDSCEMMCNVENLFNQLSKLTYYKNRGEQLVRDIISHLLYHTKTKIELTNYPNGVQIIDITKKEGEDEKRL